MLWIDDNYFLTDHSPENVLLWNETANGKWNGNVLELKLHDGVYIHGLVRTNDEVLLVEFVGGIFACPFPQHSQWFSVSQVDL